jgi:hypothetical protein
VIDTTVTDVATGKKTHSTCALCVLCQAFAVSTAKPVEERAKKVATAKPLSAAELRGALLVCDREGDL